MARYRPSTSDPFALTSRLVSKEARRRREAGTPARTQTFKSVEKIEKASDSIDKAIQDSESALKKADDAVGRVEKIEKDYVKSSEVAGLVAGAVNERIARMDFRINDDGHLVWEDGGVE